MKRLIISFILLISAAFAFALPGKDSAALEDFVQKVRAKKDAAFKPGLPYDQKRINALDKLDYEQLEKIIRAEEQDFYDYLVQNMKEKGYFNYAMLKGADAISSNKYDPEDFGGLNLTAIYAFIKDAPKTPAGKGFDYGALMPADAKVFLLGEVHQQGAWRPVARMMNSLNLKFGTRVAALESVFDGSEDYAEILSALREDQLGKSHDKNIKKKKIIAAVMTQPELASLFGQIKGLDIIGLDSIRQIMGGLNIGRDVKFPKELFNKIRQRRDREFYMGEKVFYAARNTIWIDKILPFLKAGQTVAVYSGAAHTSYTSKDYSLADYFAKTSYKPVSVFFINAENFTLRPVPLFDFSKTDEYLIEVPQEKRAQLGADYFIVYRGPYGVPACMQESNVCRPEVDSDWAPPPNPDIKIDFKDLFENRPDPE